MIVQEMLEADCRSFLARSRVGRLACVHENQPYVVPIYFAYEHPYLYAFTTPGQKIDWMRYNPFVCVEVDELHDHEHWESVVVFGRYEELAKMPDWKDPSLHALELLNRDAGWWKPGAASAAHRDSTQPLSPLFYRIHIDRMTGRRSLPDTVRLPSSDYRDQGWLHSLFHGLSSLMARRRRRHRGAHVKS